MRGLVGQQGIYLAIAQTCLVKAQILSDIIREKQVFIRMLQLIPSAVIAYNLLVLFTQCLAVYPLRAANVLMLTGVDSISLF